MESPPVEHAVPPCQQPGLRPGARAAPRRVSAAPGGPPALGAPPFPAPPGGQAT